MDVVEFLPRESSAKWAVVIVFFSVKRGWRDDESRGKRRRRKRGRTDV